MMIRISNVDRFLVCIRDYKSLRPFSSIGFYIIRGYIHKFTNETYFDWNICNKEILNR